MNNNKRDFESGIFGKSDHSNVGDNNLAIKEDLVNSMVILYWTQNQKKIDSSVYRASCLSNQLNNQQQAAGEGRSDEIEEIEEEKKEK